MEQKNTWQSSNTIKKKQTHRYKEQASGYLRGQGNEGGAI